MKPTEEDIRRMHWVPYQLPLSALGDRRYPRGIQGQHDDAVIACVLALQALQMVPRVSWWRQAITLRRWELLLALWLTGALSVGASLLLR